MKKLLIIILLLCSSVQADELQVPYSCWPQELKAEFESVGRKLDLTDSERTDDSWGYIKNEGSRYSLITYKSVTEDDFIIVKEITMKIALAKDSK